MVNEATAKARRSEALYRSSNAGISRRWLCDKVAELEHELEQLREQERDAEHEESVARDRVRKVERENAKLREELEAVGTAAYLYGRDDLKADNAKLRELNEAMWLIIRCAASHTSAEDGLPIIHEDDLAMLRSMRRELGIEVPDAGDA